MIDTVPTLHGEKVLLRPFSVNDIDEAYIGWLKDPDVVRYSNQRFLNHDRESSMRYFSSFDGTSNLFMSVRTRSDDRQIGTMTAYISMPHGTVDVGIMIGAKSVWGRGYGQDAWNTFTNWLTMREEIRKITAGTLACNYSMIKLMERSGMTIEGVKLRQEIVDKQPINLLFYAKFCEK